MIKSFGDKETEKLFNRERSRVAGGVQRQAFMKLLRVHIAVRLDDLRMPPGNQLKALTGKRKGQHSIRINDQWRICFVWRDGNAYDVVVCDYH